MFISLTGFGDKLGNITVIPGFSLANSTKKKLLIEFLMYLQYNKTYTGIYKP